MNAALVVYLLNGKTKNSEMEKISVFVAAIVDSTTAFVGLSVMLYPGTAWTDPEFETGAPIAPQAYVFVFVGHLIITWSGYILETSKLEKRQYKM